MLHVTIYKKNKTGYRKTLYHTLSPIKKIYLMRNNHRIREYSRIYKVMIWNDHKLDPIVIKTI